MRENIHYFIFLIWFCYLILTGVYIFGKGFLLTKNSRLDNSTCLNFSQLFCDYNNNVTCGDDQILEKLATEDIILCLPEKQKVALVIIDAFRYDFAVYNETIKEPAYYQNKLPIIRDLLSDEPTKSKLLKFVADPPTTTLQRIEALTTGSLPTFIDASANFATSEINEDNIIDQLVKSGGSAVLLGDDTWDNLYPGRWKRKHVLHSFNTWDLDTVDTAVDSRIYEELSAHDWDLLVAHYLGIDHAGHRYGPNHKEMERKLNELNDRLKRLIDSLPENCLLYVIGDHGMTSTGDHGGESDLEVWATLFAYSKNAFNNINNIEVSDLNSVPQIDLTPTLATLLSLPIPFSNLGTVIIDLLPKMQITNWKRSLIVTYSNSIQILHYIRKYSNDSSDFSVDELSMIESRLSQLRNRLINVSERDYEELTIDLKLWMSDVREMCREIWVKFDSSSMTRGLLLVFVSLFFHYLIIDSLPYECIYIALKNGLLRKVFLVKLLTSGVCLILWYLNVIEDLILSLLFATGICSTLVLAGVIIKYWEHIVKRWYDFRSRPLHDRLARTCLIASAVALFSNSYIIEEGPSSSFLFFGSFFALAYAAGAPKKTIPPVLGMGVLLVVSRNYRVCREEHGECYLVNDSGADKSETLITALTTIAIIATWTRTWFRNKDASEIELITIIRHFTPSVATVLISAHWSTSWGPYKASRKSRQLGGLSWLALCVAMAILWLKPSITKRGFINNLRVNYVMFALISCLGYVLTLGLKWAPGGGIAFVTGLFCLEVVSVYRKKRLCDKYVDCESGWVAVWSLLALYHFYGTGHQATFAHIRWSAAFISMEQYFKSYLVPGSMILLNTFGTHFIYGVMSPLLVLWGNDVMAKDVSMSTFICCVKYSMCFSIRTAACMLAATIHCRHLMIWKIFAPKLIYESIGLFISMLGTIVGYLLMWRIRLASLHMEIER